MFSVDRCAVMNFLFHFAKKTSIVTTREQSVIVKSQLLAAGSCIDVTRRKGLQYLNNFSVGNDKMQAIFSCFLNKKIEHNKGQ